MPGRNILNGPGRVNFDLTLNKRVPLWSERRSLEIRWDTFNTFNRANFSNPGTNVSGAATFGKITSAGGGRVMQLACGSSSDWCSPALITRDIPSF